MKNSENSEKIKSGNSGDPTKPETDSDHSGSDCDNDKTEPGVNHDHKFDKPKRETDPDTTRIDTGSDKTKNNSELLKRSHQRIKKHENGKFK